MPRRFPWPRLRRPSARRRPTVRLLVEALERRDVPAGYSVHIGTTLPHGGVEGTVDANDRVFVFDATDPNGHTVTSVSGFTATIDPGDGTGTGNTQVSILP